MKYGVRRLSRSLRVVLTTIAHPTQGQLINGCASLVARRICMARSGLASRLRQHCWQSGSCGEDNAVAIEQPKTIDLHLILYIQFSHTFTSLLHCFQDR